VAETDADAGATSAWLIYDMTTATEAPRQAVAVLQYGLLACALLGLVGCRRQRRVGPANRVSLGLGVG